MRARAIGDQLSSAEARSEPATSHLRIEAAQAASNFESSVNPGLELFDRGMGALELCTF